MILNIAIQKHDIKNNDTQHNNKNMPLGQNYAQYTNTQHKNKKD